MVRPKRSQVTHFGSARTGVGWREVVRRRARQARRRQSASSSPASASEHSVEKSGGEAFGVLVAAGRYRRLGDGGATGTGSSHKGKDRPPSLSERQRLLKRAQRRNILRCYAR